MEIKFNDNELVYITTSYVFTRIQVLTWIANGTSLLNLLEKNACDMLADIIEKTPTSKSVVANFRGVTDIDDHAMNNVFEKLKSGNKRLIIINGDGLSTKILKAKKAYPAVKINVIDEIIIIGKSITVKKDDIDHERNIYVKTFIKDIISSSFRSFKEEIRLSSTPIISNGEFDSNEIISYPHKFMWIVFFLSDKLSEVLNESKLENVKLLSASLRGAPFAVMLALIHNLKFETIDHFGPKHKVIDIDFVNHKEKGINYIYIGDFVFGGTEIKIAKTYTEMKGSKLQHALALGSLIEPLAFRHDFDLQILADLREIGDGVAQFRLFN